VGDGRSPGPAWPVRDGGRTVSSRVRRIGPTRSFPKGETTYPFEEPPGRAEPPPRRSMPDACGIVRSRYRARTGAGYVLVFLQQPGGLLGVEARDVTARRSPSLMTRVDPRCGTSQAGRPGVRAAD